MQDESAFALETLGRLAEYIKQVQERDVAYQSYVLLVEKIQAGEAIKGNPYWEIDPQGVLRKGGKV